jgi:hypothetical protein
MCAISFTLTAVEPVSRQVLSSTGGAVIMEAREAKMTFTLDATKVPAGADLAVWFFQKDTKTWIRKQGVPVNITATDGLRCSEVFGYQFALIVNGVESRTRWSQKLSTTMSNYLDAAVINTDSDGAVTVTFTDPCTIESFYRISIRQGFGTVYFTSVPPQSGEVQLKLPTKLLAGSYKMEIRAVHMTEFGDAIEGYSPTFTFVVPPVTVPPAASN